MNKLLINEDNLYTARSRIQEKLSEFGIPAVVGSNEVFKIEYFVYDWFTWDTIINSIANLIKELSPKDCLVGKIKYICEYNPLFEGKCFREFHINISYNK